MLTSILALFLALAAAAPKEVKALIDNNRVTVREVTSSGKGTPIERRNNDLVAVDLIAKTAFFVPKGTAHGGSAHEILIDLKNVSIPPLPNKTAYPLAFPREGVKKLVENNRVIVWDYTWTPGKPTVMHYHDKDVVVTYLADGDLRSTTPEGKSDVNKISFGLVRFNAPDRSHFEELVKGAARAIIVELK